MGILNLIGWGLAGIAGAVSYVVNSKYIADNEQKAPIIVKSLKDRGHTAWVCPKCNGKGWLNLIWECRECKGRGYYCKLNQKTLDSYQHLGDLTYAEKAVLLESDWNQHEKLREKLPFP